MSATKRPQHEPSMEEILASIRRIISEDGTTTKIPGAAPPTAPMKNITPPPPPRVEQIVTPPPPTPRAAPQRPITVPPPPPQPAPAQAVLELTDMIGNDGKVVRLKESVRPAAPMAPPPPPPPAPPAAMSSKAVTALQELQVAARQAAVSDAMLVPVGNLGRAFEDLVREQLRPMLQTWIDQNLPSVIERQVQKEIERISRQISDG